MSGARTRALRAAAAGLAVLGTASLALVLLVGPRLAHARLNPLVEAPGDGPRAAAVRLHGALEVVDLHADALLWDTGLLDRRGYGHVDLPRLIEGRIAVQGFTVVTKTPWGMNIEANAGDSDQITLLAFLQAWPPRTWRSLRARALHQAQKLEVAAAASGGRLVVLRSGSDLEELLRRRAGGQAVVGGVLGIEGAHALEGELAALDELFAAGFRSIGLTHFFDNEVGGSAHGVTKGGLTELGAAVVRRMEELGIAVDLAHASPALIDDVLGATRRPVLVSHTGVRGTCDNVRNLEDRHLVGVAATGGVVGIGLWETAICGRTPEAWAQSVVYAMRVAGPEHVALGSDWDGAVEAIVDAAGTVRLVDALLAAGVTPEQIRAVMGANVIRVLRQTLPPR